MKKQDKKDEYYNNLEKENELLKQKLKKLNKRLDSIIKINDKTFKSIFNKNITLERSADRFDKILHQSDRQGKSILIQKDHQEEILTAQTKMAAMGEMIDNIAHQWRQPLTAITTNASALIAKKEFGIANEKDELKALNNIIDIGQYLSDTIDDFRNFLKDDKTFKYFSLCDTFKKIEILTKSMILGNDIKLIVNIQDSEIFGIENELIQVFMNLIANSNDAFSNKKQKKLISIKTIEKNDSIIKINIKDNAGGINVERIEKIFTSGFTTKKQSGGTGIGLSMSKRILENTFAGSIEVVNENFEYKEEKYTGASFILTIPLK